MTRPTHPFIRAFSVFVILFTLLGTATSCSGAGETIAPPEIKPSALTTCADTVKANVVVLNRTLPMNRLGAVQNNGQMFAMVREVKPTSAMATMNGWDGGPYTLDELKTAGAGNVNLRSGKRPRPIVLRVNIGDCLQIQFTNFLSSNQTGSIRAGLIGPAAAAAS